MHKIQEWMLILFLPAMLAFVIVMSGGLKDWRPLIASSEWRILAFGAFGGLYLGSTWLLRPNMSRGEKRLEQME
ncbi:MAG: hypothetical protein IT428_29500 [Planctomycetaceae bacterium]|nr:hypothetical protein [Planctomycetaceae bacterium]